MKKQYSALMVAFAVTICMAAGMLLVSASAFMNKNGLAVANSPAQATATTQAKTAEEAQIQQLQNLVAQYQTREAKYQSELSTAGQQLQQANNELNQYQMLLAALQNRGYITIESNGQIVVQ